MTYANHQVAVDGAGNGFVVWHHGAAAPFRIWASRFAVGGTWSAAGPIDAGVVNAAVPLIAADPNGNALAVWQQGQRFWSNRYTPTGGWAGAAEATNFDTTNIETASLGMDAAGNAILAWGTFPGSQVHFGRYVAGTGWTFGQIPTTGAGAPHVPYIAVDAAGNAIAVWMQHDGTSANLWASRFTPSGGWGAAEPIETSALYATLHSLATDALGNAVAVWMQNDGTRNNVFATRYRVGSGWAAPEPLETSDVDASFATAAVEPGGNVHVVWRQGVLLQWARYTPGTGWSTVGTFGTGDQPQLAVSATGRVYVAFFGTASMPPFNTVIRAARFD
jgi:hypothetical protein